MIKSRTRRCTLALLLALAHGCSWFDTSTRTDPDEGASGSSGSGAGAGGAGTGATPGGASGESGSGGASGEGSGGSSGEGSGGSSGEGSGGASGEGSGGSSGEGSGGASGEGSGGASGEGSGGASGEGSGGETGVLEDAGPGGGCEPDCFEPFEHDTAPGHPEPRRFALTDQSADVGDQPRLWLLSRDADGSHRLQSLRPAMSEVTRDEWLDTGIDDVTSNPEGVSFVEDGAQQQRVFFIRHGAVQMLTPNEAGARDEDGGVTGPFSIDDLALTTDHVAFQGGDLGVAAFVRDGVQRIAVLAPAAIEGEAGGYCVLEIAEGATSTECEAAPIMHPETDVAGVVVGDEVQFYFRDVDNGLHRVVRQPDGSYEGRSLITPEGRGLAPSLVAIPSELAGYVELIAITNDGELWNARPLATDRSELTWTVIPPIGNGVDASILPAAIAAVVLHQDYEVPPAERRTYAATELRVVGDDGQQHQLMTDTEDAARPWLPEWYPVDPTDRDQRVLAIGAIANVPLAFWGMLNLASAWSVVGAERATTLQEAITVITIIEWRDHLRMVRRASLPSSAPLAELMTAVGGDSAVVAAAERAAQPPFNVALFGSADGATSFERHTLQSHLGDAPASISLLQPAVRYAGRRYHLAALERALPQDCVERPDELRQITYRRAANAAALAALQPNASNASGDYVVVRSGGEYVDNVALAITEGSYGETAHLVYNLGSPRELAYYRIAPRQATEPVEVAFGGELDLHDLPDGPPALATGLDEAMYVATADVNRFEVCQLPPSGLVTTEHCSDLSGLTRIDARELPFGAPLDAPYGACAGDAPPYYACLRDDRPFSMAVDLGQYLDPMTPKGVLNLPEARAHRVVVAYQGTALNAATASTSIWLTVAPGGDALGGWTAPVLISGRAPNDAWHYFDPEVTIDELHRVTITYAAIDASPSEGQLVHLYVAQGELDWNGNLRPLDWTPEGGWRFLDIREVGTWLPEKQPFDCVSQRAVLGAYHQPDTIDGRSLYVVREEDGYSARWLNKFARE